MLFNKRRSKRSGTGKFILKILLLVFVFFTSLGATYFWRLYKRVYVPKPIVVSGRTETGTPTPTPDPMRPRNILFLGMGGPGHEGGTLSDTMIIAHIEPVAKKVMLISIPRDLWVEIPAFNERSEFRKINQAYAIGVDDKNFKDKKAVYSGLSGGGELAKDVVRNVTGLKLDNYVAVNFSGFKKIVDVLGGVNVNVPFTFTDSLYPIEGREDDPCGKTDEDIKAVTATMSGELLEKQFLCRYEVLSFTKGQQLMDGNTALKFVRSRHSNVNGNDFGRSMRQQAFLVAVKDKLLKVGNIAKALLVIDSISRNVLTDLNLSELKSYLTSSVDLSDVSIKSISITTDNVLMESKSADRQYILIPKDGESNFTEIKKYIKDEIGKFLEEPVKTR